MEDIERRGLWWRPETPERMVGGILKFSAAAGVRLELIEYLEPTAQAFAAFFAPEEYPLVLGITDQGEPVTISRCLVTSRRTGLPIVGVTVLEASHAYIGIHLPDPENARFKRIAVRYSRLEDWIGQRSLKPDYELEGTKLRQWRLTYTPDSPITASTPVGTLSVAASFVEQGDRLRKVTLERGLHVAIESPVALTFRDWSRTVICPLQDFLSLATAKANSVVSVTALPLDNREAESSPLVRVLYQPVFTDSKLERPIPRPSMLFSFADVQNRFENILSKWFIAYDDLREALNAYFSTFYRPRYVEDRFLSVVRALEVYHRRRRRRTELPNDEFRRRRETVIQSVPEELREWVGKKLEHANELSLRDRLSELAEDSKEVILPLVGDIDDFVRTTVLTRNYYTHYNPKLEHRAAKGADLYWLTYALSCVFQVQLLGELGLTAAESVDLFRNFQGYRWAVEERRARGRSAH